MIVMNRVLEKRVMPAVTIERADDAVPVAEALLAGGLDIIEITFRTPDALKAIEAVRSHFPEMLVGAGTIMRAEQVDAALGAGAQFGVAAGLNRSVVEKAQQANLPFVPGVATPSEIERGLELDCQLQKFFPAEAAGGVPMLQALAGPFCHTGLKFIPLGGISPANAPSYLELPIVGAIGGSWIASTKLIAAKDWTQITKNTTEVLFMAQKSSN